MDGSVYGMKDAMAIARDGGVAERMALALRTDIAPELLYFLAEDSDVQVRRAIAENPATPRQADLVLSRDADATVRCLLARKIVGEGLGNDQRSQLWRMGFTILETLMRDTSLRVRRTLADVIKHMFNVPHEIVHDLATDADRRVAAPVLRHSPVLTDDDLVDIVRSGAPDWSHQAIAARDSVSERVSDALVEAGATPTVTRLLKNKSADIGEPALENIVDRAPEVEVWHEPLVERPALPRRLARKVSGFVQRAPESGAVAENRRCRTGENGHGGMVAARTQTRWRRRIARRSGETAARRRQADGCRDGPGAERQRARISDGGPRPSRGRAALGRGAYRRRAQRKGRDRAVLESRDTDALRHRDTAAAGAHSTFQDRPRP